MNLTVITAFHTTDADSAVRLYSWIAELGGISQNDVVLVHDPQEKTEIIKKVVDAVKKARPKSIMRVVTDGKHSGWPEGPNNAFIAASQFALKQKRDFLWLEPDAVPVKRGWLRSIEAEYASCGKQYLGGIASAKAPLPEKFLFGTAVYHHTVNKIVESIVPNRMNVAFDVSTSSETTKNAFKSNLFQFIHAKNSPSVVSVTNGVALFHPSKDGKMIELCRNMLNRKPEATIESNLVSDVSVVITNFKRPQMLWQAFQSCKSAKVNHIVVSSSGADADVLDVHKKILEQDKNVKITSIPNDLGCNEAWLRGVRKTITKRVTILHDDDKLLPDYENVVAGKYNTDVVHWDGLKHTPDKVIDGKYTTIPEAQEGKYPIQVLLRFLLQYSGYTLSPVCGMFPREHVIETLDECERNLGKDYMLRDRMMVGNDLMLWLRACQKPYSLYYSHKPFVSYGHWLGSASFKDASYEEKKLIPIYYRTKDYWRKTVPKIIHVVPRYYRMNQHAMQRTKVCMESWWFGYQLGLVSPLETWNYHRNSLAIGDTRQVPFLKDILKQGLNSGGPDDIVVLTNDDTITNIYFWGEVYAAMMKTDAVCSFRRNVDKYPLGDADLYPANPSGTVGPGRDAFAFKKSWLRENLAKLPDYLTAHTDWDLVLALLIRLSHGYKSNDKDFITEHPSSEIKSKFIYHLNHTSWWAEAKESVGNSYNRKLTDEFFEKNLGWKLPKLGTHW